MIERAPVPIWPVFDAGDKQRVLSALERGEVSYDGRDGFVRELEDAFAAAFGARHALATSSGTAALHSALFGLALRPGDEVLAPTYTFLATVTPIFVCNAVPVLVDADPDTGLIDVDALERCVTDRTRAIVVTHLSGFPVDMDRVMSVAQRHRLRVIEDCAQAHGAECRGRRVGNLGDAAIFSLQARKLVPAGEGGVMLTSDREIYERANLLGHFRERCRIEVESDEYRPFVETGFGLNYRMHPLAAALAIGRLAALEETLEIRQDNASRLAAALDGIPGVRPPVVEEHMTRVAYYSDQPLYDGAALGGLPRDAFVAALCAEGVPISVPRSRPLHLEALFQLREKPMRTYGDTEIERAGHRAYAPGDLPGSEAYFSRALRLPVYVTRVPELMEQFARAFAKVSRGAAQLRDWAPDAPHTAV